MMKTEDRVRAYFDHQEGRVRSYGAGVERAVALGTRYGRRRRVAGTVSGLLLAVVAVAGASFLRGPIEIPPAGEPAVQGSDPTSLDIPDFTPEMITPTLAEVDFEWSGGDSTMGSAGEILAGRSAFYALSTAPGTVGAGPEPPGIAIYRSENGVTWTSELVDEPWADGDVWSVDFAEHADRLYLITTAPGVAELGEASHQSFVAHSDDFGANWTLADLPVSVVSTGAYGDAVIPLTSTRIAAGSLGVVATVTTDVVIRYEAFVPDEYSDQRYMVFPTEAGVAVGDSDFVEDLERTCFDSPDRENSLPLSAQDPDDLPESCRQLLEAFRGRWPESAIVFETTWDELGLPEPGVTRQVEVFFSDDGSTFDAIASPFSSESTVWDLIATDDMFLAVEYVVHRSSYIVSERLETVLWVSSDGVVWDPLPGLSSDVHVAGVGTLNGAPVIVGAMPSPDGERERGSMMIARFIDGRWEAVAVSDILGEGLGEWPNAVSIGSAGVAIALQSWTGLSDSEPQSTVREGSGVLLYSPDFVTWSALDYADAVDSRVEVLSQVTVGSDRILLRGGVPTGNPRIWGMYDLIVTPG